MRILEVIEDISRNRSRLRTVARSFFYPLITTTIPLKFVAIKIKREANKCKTIEHYVDLPYDISRALIFEGWNIRPLQIKEEIMELVKILVRRKPKLILEIGTADGGTLFLLTIVSSPDAEIISVDLPGGRFGPAGRFGGGYPESRVPLYKSFARHKQKIYLIREDSHALSTADTIEKILEGRKLDLLFIDGDHAYEGVKKDFEMYSKFVGEGGIIAFHDIVLGSPENVGGVPRFWDEIKDNFKHIELVENWKQGLCGIGICIVDRS